MEAALKHLYTSPCGGPDHCNCFLHAYELPEKRDWGDKYEDLRPFLDHVKNNVEQGRVDMSLGELREHARVYVGPVVFDTNHGLVAV